MLCKTRQLALRPPPTVVAFVAFAMLCVSGGLLAGFAQEEVASGCGLSPTACPGSPATGEMGHSACSITALFKHPCSMVQMEVRSVSAACALCLRRCRALVHGWGASAVRVHGWVHVHVRARVRACASACERV